MNIINDLIQPDTNSKIHLANRERAEKIHQKFISKIQDRTLCVGIIGLGYVGLPLAQALISKGFTVKGFDINPQRIQQISSGKSPFKHITDLSVQTSINTGLYEGTSDFTRLSEPDAILICVPTPLNKYKEPDLSYVINSAEAISKSIRPGQLIVLESTTWPGTCDEVLQPILEKSGLLSAIDFSLAYSPEREDPGNAHFETSTIPKIVGANTDLELDMAMQLYGCIVPKAVPVEDCKTAEAIKVTENIFRWVNIGLVNELKTVFSKMDIDIWEVIHGAATKPFGFMPFYPGPGVGGHCIPLDPYYLSWKAKEFGISTRFIELAGEVNDSMPKFVVDRLLQELNDRFGKALKGSKILVAGLAYKADIDDPRESPSIEVIELLIERGAIVSYHDPAIPSVAHFPEHPSIQGMHSITWDNDVLNKFDAAIITTSHKILNYNDLIKSVPLVIDTRNATQGLDKIHDNVVKA